MRACTAEGYVFVLDKFFLSRWNRNCFRREIGCALHKRFNRFGRRGVAEVVRVCSVIQRPAIPLTFFRVYFVYTCTHIYIYI